MTVCCLRQSARGAVQLEEAVLDLNVPGEELDCLRRLLLARRAPLAQQRHQRRQRALLLGDGHLVVSKRAKPVSGFLQGPGFLISVSR